MRRFSFLMFFLVFGLQGIHPLRAAGIRAGSVSRQNLSGSSADPIRILALLVEFQSDEDDRTTGDGRFDLTAPEEPTVDAAPHDDGYFSDQLAALAKYYNRVSGGALVLEGTVHPDVFTLPHEMAYYNPATTEEALDHGLAELFRDAVEAANAAGVVFSDYDAYAVFHAGVGRDIDLGYDPTPSDIPSAFLSLEDLREEIGGNPAYLGIPVENGRHHVQEGMILPETESQEGYEIGLLGTMTLMFGFQVGLPALWNTETGMSGIGRWGLMDQGSGNFNGLIPAEPSAFVKVLMGWEEPMVVYGGTNLQVFCSSQPDAEKIYKVPINDHEYFLVENRQFDPNGDGVTRGWDADGNEVRFLPDGQIEVTEAVGVIVEVEEYDFGLPGSGILIWHVDEEVVAAGLADNRVNANPDHRGVDLEEADGAEDIGEAYGMFDPGGGSEAGVLHDAWFADNEIHMLTNNTDVVAFTPESFPSSRSYSGADAHLVIDGFSESGPVMRFSVSNDWAVNGFPVAFDTGNGLVSPPTFGDLDGDGLLEMMVGNENEILVWDSSAELYLPGGFPAEAVGADGAGIRSVIAVGDVNDNGRDEIITRNADALVVYTGFDEDGDGLADPLFRATVSGGIRDVMVLEDHAEFRVVCASENGMLSSYLDDGSLVWNTEVDIHINTITLFDEGEPNFILTGLWDESAVMVDASGTVLWTKTLSATSHAWASTGWLDSETLQIALFTNGNFGMHGMRTAGDGTYIDAFLYSGVSPESPGSRYAVGDIDGDGFQELVNSGDGRVWAFNHNGSLVDFFPVPSRERSVDLSAPILGDADEDGTIDILVATSLGDIEAYRSDGTMLDGFPLTTGASEAIPPTILDIDGDGDIEIAAVSEKGFLYVWDLPSAYTEDSVPWGYYRHDPQNTGMNPQRLQPAAAGEDWFPEQLAYNYPNPAKGSYTTIRYRLEAPADVRITVYDLAGELVDEFDGPGIGLTENEVNWDLEGVESGVYFGRIQAESASGSRTITIKIAISK